MKLTKAQRAQVVELLRCAADGRVWITDAAMLLGLKMVTNPTGVVSIAVDAYCDVADDLPTKARGRE